MKERQAIPSMKSQEKKQGLSGETNRKVGKCTLYSQMIFYSETDSPGQFTVSFGKKVSTSMF
jgi:hypothetical protein